MIVVMKKDASEKQIEEVIRKVVRDGFDVHRSTGVERTVLGIVGVKKGVSSDHYAGLPGVDRVIRITDP